MRLMKNLVRLLLHVICSVLHLDDIRSCVERPLFWSVILFVLTTSLHCSRSEAIVFPKEAPVDPSGSSPLSRNFVVMLSGNPCDLVDLGALQWAVRHEQAHTRGYRHLPEVCKRHLTFQHRWPASESCVDFWRWCFEQLIFANQTPTKAGHWAGAARMGIYTERLTALGLEPTLWMQRSPIWDRSFVSQILGLKVSIKRVMIHFY